MGPAPIVEAVTGLRRNLHDESTSVVLGPRCAGRYEQDEVLPLWRRTTHL